MEKSIRSIKMEDVKKFLKKKWWIVLIGILLLPIFIALWPITFPATLGWFMWSKANWSKKIKSWTTAGLVVLCLILLVSLGSKNSTETKTDTQPQTAVATPVQNQPAADSKPQADAQPQPQPENTQGVAVQQNDSNKNDFSLYEDFFTLRNQQFKTVDELLNGLSMQKHKELANSPNATTTPEWSTLSNASDALYSFSDKLDKNDPSQNIVATAIDDYSSGAIDSYRDWIFTNDQSSKTYADAQRAKGDQELNNLLATLKKQGYNGTGISDIKSTVSAANDEAGYKASCKNISYQLLEKDPSSNLGADVYFKGKIDQAGTSNGSDWFRISVTSLGYGVYTDTVWVTTQTPTNFVAGDIVRFWGTVGDTYCYQSEANFNICIPSIDAQYISK